MRDPTIGQVNRKGLCAEIRLLTKRLAELEGEPPSTERRRRAVEIRRDLRAAQRRLLAMDLELRE